MLVPLLPLKLLLLSPFSPPLCLRPSVFLSPFSLPSSLGSTHQSSGGRGRVVTFRQPCRPRPLPRKSHPSCKHRTIGVHPSRAGDSSSDSRSESSIGATGGGQQPTRQKSSPPDPANLRTDLPERAMQPLSYSQPRSLSHRSRFVALVSSLSFRSSRFVELSPPLSFALLLAAASLLPAPLAAAGRASALAHAAAAVAPSPPASAAQPVEKEEVEQRQKHQQQRQQQPEPGLDTTTRKSTKMRATHQAIEIMGVGLVLGHRGSLNRACIPGTMV